MQLELMLALSVMEMDTAQNLTYNNSAFFLVTIARWKYVSTSLQTVLGLLTVPWFLG